MRLCRLVIRKYRAIEPTSDSSVMPVCYAKGPVRSDVANALLVGQICRCAARGCDPEAYPGILDKKHQV